MHKDTHAHTYAHTLIQSDTHTLALSRSLARARARALSLSTQLMLNLIIAMMGETYAREKTNEGLAMWWMMKAACVLDYERHLSRDKRIAHRSGIDPFTSGQDRETVPFFRVDISEVAQAGLDGEKYGEELRIDTLSQLRNAIDARFHRVDARQRSMIESLVETQSLLQDKVDAMLTRLHVKSPVASYVKSPVASSRSNQQWGAAPIVSAAAGKSPHARSSRPSPLGVPPPMAAVAGQRDEHEHERAVRVRTINACHTSIHTYICTYAHAHTGDVVYYRYLGHERAGRVCSVNAGVRLRVRSGNTERRVLMHPFLHLTHISSGRHREETTSTWKPRRGRWAVPWAQTPTL